MRHCYLCDAGIPGAAARRNVRVSSTRRVSVGRRISTSSGERRGLRTVCQSCADELDRSGQQAASLASLGRKVAGIAAVGVVGFIIYVNSHGGRDLPRPSRDDFISPAHATPAEQVPPSPAFKPATRQAGGYAPFDPTPAALQSATNTVMAANAVPLLSTPAPPDSPASRSQVPWRHVTATGVNWSLRHVATGSLLMVDLGNGQVANVSVAPAFEALDLQSMNFRVDHLRSTISQFFSAQTANYSFERDGSVRLLP